MTKEQIIKHLEAAQASLKHIINACEKFTAKINAADLRTFNESNEVSGDGYARTNEDIFTNNHLQENQKRLDESVRRYDESTRRRMMDNYGNPMPSNKKIIRFVAGGHTIDIEDAKTFFIIYHVDHGLKHQFCTQPIIKN